MSRDYKPKTNKTSNGSPFLSGLLFGFLLGVVASVALTIYIKGDTSPFEDKKINAPKIESLPQEAISEKDLEVVKPEDDLDFYTILPETESAVTVKEINDANIEIKNDSYFLQIGSFKKEADANNLKAELALQGFEAIVQTANIPEKGTWHRVRVGPLNSIDSINKARNNLTANNFNVDLIKIKQ
ncbi:MAG: SPOR domain-containing protein [Methylophilaceae bacterium]